MQGKEGLGGDFHNDMSFNYSSLLEDFFELLGPMPDFIVRELPNGQDLGFFNSVDWRVDARAENVLPNFVGKDLRGLPG